MFCDICGRELEAEARFCDACGRRLTIEELPWGYTTSQQLPFPGAPAIQEPIPGTVSLHFPEVLICGICGRGLEAGDKFCDTCGRRLTIEEQPWRHTTPAYLVGPSVGAIREPVPVPIPPHEVTMAPVDQATPARTFEPEPMAMPFPQRAPEEPRPLPQRRPRFSRRLILSSAIGLAAIAIIAVSLFAYPSLTGGTLPFWQGATSSQTTTTTTSTTGGALQVKIDIAKNPTTIGSIQTITFAVLDPGGQPVAGAAVHVEVTFPSGRTSVSDRQTDANGVCTLILQIANVPANVGTFKVNASATKAGYETGQAGATYQVAQTSS